MKYQDKPHKKTEDKKSFITKLREKTEKLPNSNRVCISESAS